MTRIETLPEELQGWPTVVELPVLWGDMDAFGHVNNTIYLRWFESARIAYLHHGDMDKILLADGLGPILASIRCNYRRQVRYPDRVWIGARVSEIGRTSLQVEHVIYGEQEQAIVADGLSVVVVFHYGRQRPTPVPDIL
ncbi:MAG: acyl-CoA thioesterase, partial [Planctomycetes bacterium]|nr:acyl-CoA thioesterase [Planctomycetota bacterium]